MDIQPFRRSKTFYFASLLQAVHFDFREPVGVYASHAIRVIDQAAFHSKDTDDDDHTTRRIGRQIIGLLMLALAVGYIVSFTSTLWVEYRYSWTLDTPGKPLNDFGTFDNTRKLVDDTGPVQQRQLPPQLQPRR